MSLLTDGLLIATCLTAGLYCFVLSRRLKRFSSTEEGVGQQVVQLNAALEETRGALKEAQSGAKAETEALSREIVQARKLSSQLNSLIQASEKIVVRERVAQDTVERVEVIAKSKAASPIELDPGDDDSEDMNAKGPEDDNDGLEDLDLSLAEADGEQQLGFMPDIEPDEDEGMDPSSLQDDADSTDQDDSFEDDMPGTSDTPEEPTANRDPNQGESLLKIERMAL